MNIKCKSGIKNNNYNICIYVYNEFNVATYCVYLFDCMCFLI